MIAGGYTWTPNPDGDYRQHETLVKGKLVAVFSDRDGSEWMCEIDGGECMTLEASSLEEACAEAVRLASE